MQKNKTTTAAATAQDQPGEGVLVALPPEAIARRAYEIYERRGQQPGHELEDWLAAEAELQSALTPRSPPLEANAGVRRAADRDGAGSGRRERDQRRA